MEYLVSSYCLQKKESTSFKVGHRRPHHHPPPETGEETKMNNKHKRIRATLEDKLIDVAAEYLRSLGANPLIMGIRWIRYWPGDLKYNWELIIRCTGKPPTTPLPKQGKKV